jgi:ABC-2 type transport system permease protein/oleandomycin transport system permease protein
MADAVTLAYRNVLRYLRLPNILLVGLVQPVLLLLLFRYVLGGAVRTRGVRYVEYLIPGAFAMAVIFGSAQAGVGLAEDIASGVAERLQVLPINRTAIFLGRVLSDLGKNAVVLALVAAVACAAGFRASASFGEACLSLALLLMLGVMFAWLSMLGAVMTRSAEAAQGIGAIVALIASFASSGFVPVSSMPDWLQTVAGASPVTHTVDAVRGLTTPLHHGVGADVVAAGLWWMAVMAVTIPLASYKHARLGA